MRRIYCRRKNRFFAALVKTMFALGACYALVLFFVSQCITPVLESAGRSKVDNMATRMISEAVAEVMKNGEGRYDHLLQFDKDEEGAVNSVTSDIVAMNELKSKIAVAVLDKVEIELTQIRIPAGNFLSGDMLAGRGPKITFKIVPVTSVRCNVRSVFTAAGINQTKHQTLLDIEVDMGILMPIKSVSNTIKTSICIAETVLMGKVPDYYTSVTEYNGEGAEGTPKKDSIADYGPENFVYE